MIHIHWLWLPLIITIILDILAEIVEDDVEMGPLGFMGAFASGASTVIYIVAGILWICSHIIITT